MSRASRLKGPCGRLIAIYELPADPALRAWRLLSPRQLSAFQGSEFALAPLYSHSLRPRLFLSVAVLVSVLYSLPSFANDAPEISPSVTQGGMTCFTITPPPSHGSTFPPSCDKLCEKRGSACSGVTSSISPPLSCESESGLKTCRCCKVAK